MFTNIMIVAAGSATGGVVRYVASYLSRNVHAPLPFWTLGVNVVGGFLIGVFAVLLTGSERWRLLAVTGFCGGFTTFSAFSLETLELFQQGANPWAVANVVLNVVLSIAACWAGYALCTRAAS